MIAQLPHTDTARIQQIHGFGVAHWSFTSWTAPPTPIVIEGVPHEYVLPEDPAHEYVLPADPNHEYVLPADPTQEYVL